SASEHLDASFDTAVQLVVTAMLQDPKFLYRVEVGEELESRPGAFRLDGYEVATRLSFLVWGSTPDDELLDLAAADMLADADTRDAALHRMLDDPRALRQLDDFHGQWLRYDNAGLPADLEEAMRNETRALIHRAALDPDYGYMDLFASGETFIESDALAEHYGVSGATPGWLPVADVGRGGILGQATFLAAHNNPGGTSPTKRGVFIREWLMCNEVPPPPPEAADDLPAPTSDSPCKVERLQEVHHADPTCAACHESFDPIGFGLENYDAIGRYRAFEPDDPETAIDESVECAIDGEGAVPGLGTFSGPGELGELLAGSTALEACMVRQLHRFAVGRDTLGDGSEAGRLQAMTEAFATSDHDFTTLLTEFVRRDDFVLRRVDEEN
ncbi:MAG: DUF1588 domain-containing protein, partial [Myxococcota bacterium]